MPIQTSSKLYSPKSEVPYLGSLEFSTLTCMGIPVVISICKPYPLIISSSTWEEVRRQHLSISHKEGTQEATGSNSKRLPRIRLPIRINSHIRGESYKRLKTSLLGFLCLQEGRSLNWSSQTILRGTQRMVSALGEESKTSILVGQLLY
jgi:hypothetical protein